MPRYFSDQLLHALRNHIDMASLLEHLCWPHKQRNGQLAFLCPLCQEFRSAVNPRTNLGRCFCCETNFNPIDFFMTIRGCDFVEAVHSLQPLLRVTPRDDTSA